jgi:hypothetical protein
VVYAKAAQRQAMQASLELAASAAPPTTHVDRWPPAEAGCEGPAVEERPSSGAWAGRAILWVSLLVLLVRFGAHDVASNAAGESFLHLVNLVFHEAGHVLFSPFGRFITVLGGTLGQLLVPLVCTVALLRHGDRFGASATTWWCGQNLLDVAPYINDARALQLVLLGGRTGAEVEGHDWEFILQSLGLLHWDHRLAALAHGAGLVVMAAALAWGALILARGPR